MKNKFITSVIAALVASLVLCSVSRWRHTVLDDAIEASAYLEGFSDGTQFTIHTTCNAVGLAECVRIGEIVRKANTSAREEGG